MTDNLSTNEYDGGVILAHLGVVELEGEALAHYGVKRRSGRYPWGSGENPGQRSNTDFLMEIKRLKKEGMTETEIAAGMGLNTTQLRAARAMASNRQKRELEGRAIQLKEKQWSNVAIGKELGINESSVRALLDPVLRERRGQLEKTRDDLKAHLDQKQFLDIGKGVENHLGVSPERLKTAVAMLEQEGYEKFYVKEKQLGTGEYTTIKVLAPPGTKYSEVSKNREKIGSISDYDEATNTSKLGLKPVKSVSMDRVEVRYGPDGGSQKDGVIELRRGVSDLDLGDSRYAQVRIGVDGKHYLKGMAHYADDLPDGVDIRFNTNKSDTGNKADAMKPMKISKETGKIDKDNPFGASIKPGGQKGALNIVNEEGDWDSWSRSLSSQMLSKQKPELAKQQLDLAYKIKKDEFDEISSLTNPVVKRKLLESFADDADSSAIHLRAAALPRQGTHVILPLNSIKETEIYAPKYRDGEKVVLVRYPHAGTFEIPELTVNNKNPEAKRLFPNAQDAVGIHAKVAEQLSGADFDGDSVMVIPQGPKSRIISKPPLKELEGFDPKVQYKEKPGMKYMSKRNTQLKMGDVSNLITDMQIMGATDAELARAVKHSMVVIDAEKHKLDWQQSAKDNGIPDLKLKYQGAKNAGAQTVISRASSQARVPKRKDRPVSEGGPIDPLTGERRYVPTGETRLSKSGKEVPVMEKLTKMGVTNDARTLLSGPDPERMELIYADYANQMKSLGNAARKEYISTKTNPMSKSAKETYASEVASLNAKLNVALKNAPVERKAQLLANATVRIKRQADPTLEGADLKKVENQALAAARLRTGAGKARIEITPSEWQAIQAGAVSNSKLESILSNTDIDKVKQLATPRAATVMTPSKKNMAKQMLARGYTQSEVAAHLGIPASTINSALSGD